MTTTRFTYGNVVDSLIEEVPEFSRMLDEHLDNYDELLPHVLFGDLTRFLIDTYRAIDKSDESKSLFLRVLDFIEESYVLGDRDVKQLIEASFLENLHQAGNDYGEIKKHLGKNTAKQLWVIENWSTQTE